MSSGSGLPAAPLGAVSKQESTSDLGKGVKKLVSVRTWKRYLIIMLKWIVFNTLLTRWFEYLDMLVTSANTILIVYAVQSRSVYSTADPFYLWNVAAIIFFFVDCVLRCMYVVYLILRYGLTDNRAWRYIFDLFNLIDASSVTLG
jgi:hypothetical protein